MAAGRGANARIFGAFEGATTYGVVPGSGFIAFPFTSDDGLGEEQTLEDSDVLGEGREPQDPDFGLINNTGTLSVPIDLRGIGHWLKLMYGAPVTVAGIPASGSYTFSAQPTDNATITVAGQAFTYVSSAPGANQILKGATVADTVVNTIRALKASAVTAVKAATYYGDITAPNKVFIEHKTPGSAGNSFTIVAGTSPASNATASAATLANGADTGRYNHTFVSGAQTLPSMSIETAKPDVPSYEMNFGCCGNTMTIPLARTPKLRASIAIIGQGSNPPAASSSAGTPTDLALEFFTQFAGTILRDGVPLGNVVSGSFQYSNGLNVAEVIRSDGRIGGILPGQIALNQELVTRFDSHDLLNLAIAKTPVEISLGWSISANKKLTIVEHRLFLPKPKRPVQNAGVVQATFSCRGAEDQNLSKSTTVTLVNDVASYA